MRINDEILGSHTRSVVLLAQDVGVFVLADAADVESGMRRKDVLGAAGGVLSSAASEEDGGAVGEQVFVKPLVFGFGEDGVVGFEAIFIEHGCISIGVQICQLECKLNR